MAATSFASVKLPSALVEQARQAAQSMRRSVASQIEYWATLGQIVEHTGLSAQEARAAIEQYEAAPHAQATAPASVDALTARLLAAQTSGLLAQRVRAVVRENQSHAG
jgi:ethanolamine utilization protein EutQ (cupin superfamily)